MPNFRDRLAASHEVMLGKPVIRGTRITVELVLRKMSQGATAADLLLMYPQLELIDVQAVLEYATALLADEEIMGLAA